MAFYYKVPKKVDYKIDRTYDEEGNLVSEVITDEIESIRPDIPINTVFCGHPIDDDYYLIKVKEPLENATQVSPKDIPTTIKLGG